MRTCTGLSLHIFHPKTDAYTIANSPQLGTCTGTKITPFPNANLVSISLIFISPAAGRYRAGLYPAARGRPARARAHGRHWPWAHRAAQYHDERGPGGLQRLARS